MVSPSSSVTTRRNRGRVSPVPAIRPQKRIRPSVCTSRRIGAATTSWHHSRWMYGRLRNTCSSKYRVVFTLSCPHQSSWPGLTRPSTYNLFCGPRAWDLTSAKAPTTRRFNDRDRRVSRCASSASNVVSMSPLDRFSSNSFSDASIERLASKRSGTHPHNAWMQNHSTLRCTRESRSWA